MKRLFLMSFIVALIPTLFYLYCLSPGVSWEDSGEFITTASSLGIAHPPGHPLYILLAHLFTIHRAPQTIAHSVNLFSVIAAFLALFVFSMLLSIFSRSSPGERNVMLSFLALLSITMLFAFSRTFWYVTEISEVYSLHALLTLCLFASLILFAQQGGKYLLLFAYLFGLSLTNNVTIAYLTPAFVCFLIVERKRIEKRSLIPSFLLFLLGISLYCYVPVRARFHPIFNWGDAATMKHFLHLLTAQEFSKGFLSLAYAETSLFPTLLHLLREISFWAVIPLIFGFFILFKKKRTIATLFIVAIVSNITLSFFTGRGPDLNAYFLPSTTLFFLTIGYGIMYTIDRLKGRAWLSLPLLLVLSLTPLLLNHRHNCARGDTDARNYGIALMGWLPEKAVLLTENTNDYFILTYLSEVEPGKDVDILYAPLFKETWYRERLVSSGFQWDEPLTPLSLARSSSREVFYTPGAGISLPIKVLSPYGPLFRIVIDEEPSEKQPFTLPPPVREQGKRRYAYLFARFGEFYFARKEYPAAIAAFEQAKGYDPFNGAIYHNLAILHKKLHNRKEAVFYEQKAKSLGFPK
jgi:hypothetical protein